jgi:hypothetical protein
VLARQLLDVLEVGRKSARLRCDDGVLADREGDEAVSRTAFVAGRVTFGLWIRPDPWLARRSSASVEILWAIT